MASDIDTISRAAIATRQRRFDYDSFWGYLPDPDPILEKTGDAMDVYRGLVSDSQVWACGWQSLKAGVLAREWKITASDDAPVPARKLKAFVDIYRNFDVYQSIDDMLDAPFYGMAPMEIEWESGELWTPASVVGKPPEWFVFDFENKLRFLSDSNWLEGEELPYRKFLLPKHHASYLNPYGERLLAKCFWPVIFKKGGWRYWSVFIEKFGMPWVHGKVPPSTDAGKRAQFKSDLVSMVQDAVAVTDDSDQIIINPAGAKTASADIYSGLIESANKEIAKAILGQTLTTDIGKSGSYAASTTHATIRDDVLEYIEKMIANQYNQLNRWINELNFGSGNYPIFKFVEEENIQEDRAKRDTELKNQGVQFSKNYYVRTYDFLEDDLEVTDPAQEGPEGEATKAEFAETDNRKPGEAVDDLVEEAEAPAQDAFDKMLMPVMDFIDQADTLEDISEKLFSFYPKMDTQSFRELISRAQFRAAQDGFIDAD